MSIQISNEKPIKAKSGTGLRFSVTMKVSEEHWQTSNGYLVFRCHDGTLDIKTPITVATIFGRRIKIPMAEVSPATKELIRDYLERQWGSKIVEDPDWNEFRKEEREKQAKDAKNKPWGIKR